MTETGVYKMNVEEERDDKTLQDILDRWERGEELEDDDVAVIERMVERDGIDPRSRGLLECVRRDVFGPSGSTSGPAASETVDAIMSSLPKRGAVIPAGDRFARVATGIGAAAAGFAMLIGSVALLLHVTGGAGPREASVARGDSVDAGGVERVAASEEYPQVLGRTEDPASRDTYLVVRFQLYAPEAGEVSLVGDFNEWDPDRNQLADPEGNGAWEVEIRVRPGEVYTYNFLIDGERWVPDPNAMRRIRDSFGGEKSVLSL